MHNIFSPLVTHRAGYSGLGRDDDDVAIHLKHSFFFKNRFHSTTPKQISQGFCRGGRQSIPRTR